MKYIILTGEGDRDFIAEQQSDGSYKKIAQLFNVENSGAIVGHANVGYEEHLNILRGGDKFVIDGKIG